MQSDFCFIWYDFEKKKKWQPSYEPWMMHPYLFWMIFFQELLRDNVNQEAKYTAGNLLLSTSYYEKTFTNHTHSWLVGKRANSLLQFIFIHGWWGKNTANQKGSWWYDSLLQMELIHDLEISRGKELQLLEFNLCCFLLWIYLLNFS